MLDGHRRPGLRRPGRRQPLLHVRVDDGPRDARVRGGGQGVHRARSAEPDRRRRTSRAARSAPGFESFVGLVSCPNRHGMTAGEIARLARTRSRSSTSSSRVIAMRGWDARHVVRAHRPAVGAAVAEHADASTPRSSIPGMCLVEGTELSEARGTTRPFELSGAPYLDGHRLGRAADGDGAAGRAVPAASSTRRRFTSTRAGRAAACRSTSRTRDRSGPYRTGVAFLKACTIRRPTQFAWRAKAYEFVDKIAGDRSAVRQRRGPQGHRGGRDARRAGGALAARRGRVRRASARRACCTDYA